MIEIKSADILSWEISDLEKRKNKIIREKNKKDLKVIADYFDYIKSCADPESFEIIIDEDNEMVVFEVFGYDITWENDVDPLAIGLLDTFAIYHSEDGMVKMQIGYTYELECDN